MNTVRKQPARISTSSQHTSRARRILVTGGLGFIGYHLSEALLEHHADCELTIVDNLSSTKLDYQSLAGRAAIHISDLREFKPDQHGYDDIYHLASPVGSLGILDRHGYIARDIIDLAHVASQLAAMSGARLLYLSSSEVYGRDGRHDETADQVVPDRHGTRMEYALGKLAAEHVLMNLADSATHDIRIVRPFNVIGCGQSERLGFVIPAFFSASLSGEPLFVHGDGLQTRSFCDVNDLVAGLIAVQHKGRCRTIYNVGNPANKTTIFALAQRIKSLCRSDSQIRLINPQEHYGPRYLEAFNKMPVIERVMNDTNWRPMLGLDDILSRLHTFHSNVDGDNELSAPVTVANTVSA